MKKSVIRRVPIFLQPRTKPYCGAAAAKMVAAYHGVRASLPRLVKEIGVRETRGVHGVYIGLWFQQNGFSTTIICADDDLPASYTDLDSETAHARIRRLNPGRDSNQRVYRKGLRRFLDEGGTFIPRPPRLGDIKEALLKGEPPIVNINVATIYGFRKWRAGHFVVPVGYRNDKIFLNDSNFPIRQTYEAEELMWACHSWRGSVMLISPK